MERLKNVDGFTFIELLIGLFITLLVAGFLVFFTRLSFDSHLSVSNSIDEIWDSRQTMNLICDELKYAIEATPAADKHSVNYTSLDPPDYQTIKNNRIYLNNDNFICIQNSSGNRIVSKFPVDNFICDYNTNDELETTIDITINFSDQTTLSTSIITLNNPTKSNIQK
jgi:hypothetical protein